MMNGGRSPLGGYEPTGGERGGGQGNKWRKERLRARVDRPTPQFFGCTAMPSAGGACESRQNSSATVANPTALSDVQSMLTFPEETISCAKTSGRDQSEE